MENEIWMPIKGFEGLYEVSNLGRVKSLARTCNSRVGGKKPIKEKILAEDASSSYLRVRLSKSMKTTHALVHRIVAEAFVPNPENLPQVNHINENKRDNRAENLEWCTAKYNTNYGNRIEKIKKNQPHKRAICQYDMGGNFIAEFQSIHEAGRMSGMRWQDISACCRGDQKTSHGYIWKYKN